MDLQRSGDNYLIFIETENIIFTLRGERFGIDGDEEVKIKGNFQRIDCESKLYLNEYSDYEIFIECKTDVEVEFHHENINIKNKIRKIRPNSKILTGTINFRGDLGYTDLIVKVDGKEELYCKIEVYPTKLDYKKDYRDILNDINSEVYNLAYGFLGRTYVGSRLIEKNTSTDSELYRILNFVYEGYLKSIDIILENPHHKLEKRLDRVDYRKIKGNSKENMRWIEKRPFLLQEVNGKRLPREGLNRRKTVTTDTRENRFVKYMLEDTIAKLEKFKKKYLQLENTNLDIVDFINEFKREINKRIKNTFLNNIEGEYKRDISLVLVMGNGYKDMYNYYLMLRKSLEINSNILKLSLKQISELYEYWCFIKINKILRENFEFKSGNLMKIKKDKLYVELKKGIESKVVYRDEENIYELVYNRVFINKTVLQRPDIVLKVTNINSKEKKMIIFDAKYKIDKSERYISMYGGIGAKEEDINTMHRYRDSIKENIVGAYILFPHKNLEEYKENRFYKSINEEKIGAIPFLPFKIEYLEKIIKSINNSEC